MPMPEAPRGGLERSRDALWGRGWYHIPTQSLYTWPEHEGTHSQVASQLDFGDPFKEAHAISIGPDGRAYDSDGHPVRFNEIGPLIQQADPRLTPETYEVDPDESKWYQDAKATGFYPRVGAVCPTCKDPLKGEYGTFCPRCQWSEMDANMDSDPLGNPPDPTRDLHKGIQSRVAMPMSPDLWQEYVAQHPYAYHGGDPDHDALVQQHGLVPWDQLKDYGIPYNPGPSEVGVGQPRPGHVYLTTTPYSDDYDRVWQVDLRKLDPHNINPDEDWYSDSDSGGAALRDMGRRRSPSGQEAHDLDLGVDPEHTRQSMEWGKVGHRGIIPPEALSVWQPNQVVGSVKVADKLHDFLMNPKSRPDLQTPEGQRWLAMLQSLHGRIGPKFDQLTPWLTREWKKNRIEQSRDGETGHPYFHVPINDQGYVQRVPLGAAELGHWADFLESGHPLRRELGDIMQHHVNPFHDRVQAWNQAMEQEAHDRALEGGNVVHATPDNWTVRQLTTPEELEAEGDAMGHCVGGYGSAVQNGRSLIYSLRDPNNRPHATLEMDPGRQEQPFDIERAMETHPTFRHVPPEVKDRLRAYAADPDWSAHEDEPAWDEHSLGQVFNQLMSHDRENTSQPVPEGGRVVQVQGRANQEPKDEYKQRLRSWFTSFPTEKRPIWGGYGPDWDDEPTLLDDEGYTHSRLDEPGLIPEWERINGGLRLKTEPYEDAYGLLHDPNNIESDYDDLLDNIKFRSYGYYDQPDRDHIADIYRLARERGEIPQLAGALEGYSDKQQQNFDEWTDMNYQYAPRYVDEPHGWEDEHGTDVEEDEGGRPYWMPDPASGERYYDPGEAEAAYDEAYGAWAEQHPGITATNNLYGLLKPHYYNGAYQNEPQPEAPQTISRQQAFAVVIPSHRHRWFDAVDDDV